MIEIVSPPDTGMLTRMSGCSSRESITEVWALQAAVTRGLEVDMRPVLTVKLGSAPAASSILTGPALP